MVVSDARAAGKGFLKSTGFWAVLEYRMRKARSNGWVPWLTLLLPNFVLRLFVSSFLDVELSSRSRIGPFFQLPHPTGVIVAPGCEIGAHVTIFQQVTLGYWQDRVPRIRSHAAIFAGAKIIGGVTLGRRCFIGANAVVVKDVPNWHTAVGVPATSRPRPKA